MFDLFHLCFGAEEAAGADVVALMRGGALLAEDNPAALLSSYACDTLEEVFLKCCQAQSDNISVPVTTVNIIDTEENVQSHPMDDHVDTNKSSFCCDLTGKRGRDSTSHSHSTAAPWFVLPRLMYVAAILYRGLQRMRVRHVFCLIPPVTQSCASLVLNSTILD